MRAKLLSGLAALALIAASNQPALAAAQCMQAAEKAAFNVRALQSQLMMAALTCGQQDEYNMFVQRHQRTLSDAHQRIASHFGRMYGSAGEEQLDRYITDLANAQSQDGMRQGSSFCHHMKPFFQEAMALRDAREITRFTTEKNVTNPYSFAACVPLARSGIPDETADQDLNVPVQVTDGTALAWPGAAMKEHEHDGRDMDALSLETKLSEITRTNELLQQRIDALEGALNHRQQRR
jgi:hypothetical protein